jgi:transcriptional regulator with XRE-family HTH domain
MTPYRFREIRERANLSQRGLARLLRLGDKSTVFRYENGSVGIPGPVSIVMEMLEAGDLPERFFAEGNQSKDAGQVSD